jgi:hypothetical protein
VLAAFRASDAVSDTFFYKSGFREKPPAAERFLPRISLEKPDFICYISFTPKNIIAMKKLALIVAACLLLPYPMMAQKMNDEQAIKAVIERETKAYFSIDYKNWMESWSHVPYAYWSYADTAGINYFEGWKAIEIGFTDYFVTSKPSKIDVDRTWEDLRIYKDGAYARFKQTLTTNGIKGPEQTEIRVLEKDKNANNQWKIVLVGVLKK